MTFTRQLKQWCCLETTLYTILMCCTAHSPTSYRSESNSPPTSPSPSPKTASMNTQSEEMALNGWRENATPLTAELTITWKEDIKVSNKIIKRWEKKKGSPLIYTNRRTLQNPEYANTGYAYQDTVGKCKKNSSNYNILHECAKLGSYVYKK